jgi:hypothetical protein
MRKEKLIELLVQHAKELCAKLHQKTFRAFQCQRVIKVLHIPQEIKLLVVPLLNVQIRMVPTSLLMVNNDLYAILQFMGKL